MTQEWLYKATNSIASWEDTAALALQDGFLAKSAYEKSDRKTRADHVKHVVVGDTIHFYFKHLSDELHDAKTIGTFEVASKLPNSVLCSWPTEETHLVTVLDDAFIGRLIALKYAQDPVLGVVTGWALKKLDVATPPYEPSAFPSMRCFVKRQ